METWILSKNGKIIDQKDFDEPNNPKFEIYLVNQRVNNIVEYFIKKHNLSKGEQLCEEYQIHDNSDVYIIKSL
jgi:hypothetical protein